VKTAAFIPARLEAGRFPRKLLQDLGGKPVIVRTYENAVATGLFDRVWVITDSPEIAQVIKDAGGTVRLSRRFHPTGTDRIAPFAAESGADVILNIQGDEPFVSRRALAPLLEVLDRDPDGRIDIASLMRPVRDEAEFKDPNLVKVVTDADDFALYFSRAPIPWPKDGIFRGARAHIGVYAFRRPVLERVASLSPSPLEQIEGLENLRFLQAGFRIKMVLTDEPFTGIDTPADLERARKLWRDE